MNRIYTFLLLPFFLSFLCAKGQTGEEYSSWEHYIDLGLELYDAKDYHNSEKQFSQAYQIAQNIFTKKQDEFGYTVVHLAQSFDYNRNYNKAIPFYLEYLNYLKLNKEDDELEYALFQQRIGTLYRFIGDFANSLKIYFECLREIEIIQGKETIKYSELLLSISIVYKKLGSYDNAIKANNLSNEIVEKLYGSKSEIYAQNLTSLSQVYIEIGLYNKALLILNKVLPRLKTINPKGESYLQALITKGALYNKTREYEKEIPLYEEVKTISQKGEPAYITANNNLSVLYEELGYFEKALSIAIELANNTPEEDADHPIRFQNLAYIYAELGELDKSLKNYQTALSSCEIKFGTQHPQYAELIDCIGQYYYNKGDFQQAKTYFEEAISILLNNFDENHSKYGFYLTHYTSTLLSLNKNDEAFNLMKRNIKLSESRGDIENQDYYRKQFGLAQAYVKTGNYNEALNILKVYTYKVKQKLGNEHEDYGKMLKSMGKAYMGLGDLINAIPILDTFNSVQITQINKVFKFRSEKEKKSFLNIINQEFDELQSIAYQINKPKGHLNEINLNNQMMFKGLLLNNSKDLIEGLTSLNNAEVNKDLASYFSVKRQLTKNLQLAQEDRLYDVDSIENIKNSMESNLVKVYSTYFKDDFRLNQSWRQSQSKLSDDDIAIEFSHFQYSNRDIYTDSILYAAYIYKKCWEYPKMIPLFEEKQLKSILANRSPKEMYTTRGSKVRRINNVKAIYDLVWEPLEDYLKENDNVYYAASGLLNQIAFAALKKENEESLSIKYNLYQLSSTIVLAKERIQPKIDNALFIGGIDYDSKVASENLMNVSENWVYNKTSMALNRSDLNRGENWKYLPGTLKEITVLKNILESYGSKVDKLTGSEANETNFKILSGNSPNILHVATHGFFYENMIGKNKNNINNEDRNRYRLAEDPLMRSGLVFAGVNYELANNTNANNRDDGILTAMEISNMDLSKTDIVVLSACETGLGDIDGSEGVYGLQRAFKIAGVDIIVMSLWEVPDAETAEFMSLFYSNWIKNNNVKNAFNLAQRTMQTKYNDEPEKWAAFVLFE